MSEPSDATATSPIQTAFDYRDEASKAAFLAMIGGGKKGKKKTVGESLTASRESSPALKPRKSPVSGATSNGVNGGESMAALSLDESRERRKNPKSPTSSRTNAINSSDTSSIDHPADSDTVPATEPTSGSESNVTAAALATLARIKKSQSTDKASALAALSSKIKQAASNRTNNYDTIAQSPSSDTINYRSITTSTSDGENLADAINNDSAEIRPILDSNPSQLTSPVTSSSQSSPTLTGSNDRDDEELSDDDNDAIDDVIQSIERDDNVRGIASRDDLDAIDNDDQLNQSLPWKRDTNTHPGNDRGNAASPLLRSGANHFQHDDDDDDNIHNENGSETLTVANDYDDNLSVYTEATNANADNHLTVTNDASNGDEKSPNSILSNRRSPSPQPTHSPSFVSPYIPFSPEPDYFKSPPLPDHYHHGSHIKLILFPYKRQTRKVLLPLQNWLCPECSTTMSNRMFKRPRYCYYTGLYYCRTCHGKQYAMVPGRLLWYGDSKKYKVCKLAYNYLRSIYTVPVLPMAAINPDLYRASRRLRYAFLLRQQLVYLKEFILACQHRDTLLKLFGDRCYMLNDSPVLATARRGVKTAFTVIVRNSETQAANHSHIHSHAAAGATHSIDEACRDMYSMRDLHEILRGDLTQKLSVLVSTLIAHVVETDCASCTARVALCAGRGCHDRKPIYRFQVHHVIECLDCGNLFHRHCWPQSEQQCPACARARSVSNASLLTMSGCSSSSSSSPVVVTHTAKQAEMKNKFLDIDAHEP